MIRHVLMLNLAGRGYTTWSGSPTEPLESIPMAEVGPKLSETTLALCDAVERTVRTMPTRLCMAARRDLKGPTVVAVARFLSEATDDLGRKGLVSVHALELGPRDDLARAVLAMILHLKGTRSRSALDEFAALAREPRDPVSVLTARVTEIERAIHRARQVIAPTMPRDVARIEHDIPGSTAVVWSAFAMICQTREAPWQVIDGVEDDRVVTVLTPSRGKSDSASSILMNALGHELDTVAASRHNPSGSANENRDEATVLESYDPTVISPTLHAEFAAAALQKASETSHGGGTSRARRAVPWIVGGASGMLVGLGAAFGVHAGERPAAVRPSVPVCPPVVPVVTAARPCVPAVPSALVAPRVDAGSVAAPSVRIAPSAAPTRPSSASSSSRRSPRPMTPTPSSPNEPPPE